MSGAQDTPDQSTNSGVERKAAKMRAIAGLDWRSSTGRSEP